VGQGAILPQKHGQFTQEWPLTEPSDIARRIVDILADRQAEEIVLLDIGRVAPFADYFVIASAVNPRHMRALIETLSKELRQDGLRCRQEGAEDSGWVLLDYGAVIVHFFSPEVREHYALEELWRAATTVVRIQ
jgi:ribosome-associated protein